jgi:hypothetical protein
LASFGSSTSGEVRDEVRAFAVPSLAVVYVGGYDSAFNGVAIDPRLEVFSYQGLDRQGRPLPYGDSATHESVDRSAQLLARQVSTIHERTRLPVALVGESEGTVVIRKFLDTMPHTEVSAAVLMSPLVRPGRIYYPPPGATAGWGVAAGSELRGLLWLVRLTDDSGISPDEPFVRSILDNAPLYRDRMLCPVPGVRMIAFVPTAEGSVIPPGLRPGIPVLEVPGVHAGLGGRAEIQANVQRFLASGSPVDGVDAPAYGVIQKVAAAWQAPALPIRLNPAWPPDVPDASFGDDGCSYPHR